MSQAVRLKRSEKTYLSGLRSITSKLNEEAKEYNWLDKCIELIRVKQTRKRKLKKLWVIE